jgi:hypothetical protein
MPQRTRTRAGGPEPTVSPEETLRGAMGEPAVFRKEGEYWTIAYGQTVSRLRDTKGLVYISYLLHHPGVEFHVLDLVQRATHPEAPHAQAALPDSEEELAQAGIHIGNLGDAGEVLDNQARSAYRRRLTELREQLDEAKQFNHLERAAEIEREMRCRVTRADIVPRRRYPCFAYEYHCHAAKY